MELSQPRDVSLLHSYQQCLECCYRCCCNNSLEEDNDNSSRAGRIAVNTTNVRVAAGAKKLRSWHYLLLYEKETKYNKIT